MRADQAVMICVGAIGAYAVYRMLKAPKGPQTTEQAPASVQANAPSLEGIDVLQGPLLRMKQGVNYRMRLELDGGLPPFSASSSDQEMSSALKQLGFSDVQVFRDPPRWFQTATVQNPGPGTRFVIGTWSQPLMGVPRPKSMALIWESKS